jgi:hypothetical protein
MEALEKRLEALEQQTQELKHHTQAVERRLRWWRRIAYGLGVLAVLALPLASVKAQVGASLEQRVEELEYKLAHVTSGPDDITISGANLRIVNGLGTTNSKNGLGNLIVGYNEHRQGDTLFCGPPPSPSDTRTGSHNVVVGTELNFSSYGGLVVGRCNDIIGALSSVTGGTRNVALGDFASVSGGSGNAANGTYGSVTGGVNNRANFQAASVSGGFGNTASAFASSVSGGSGNTASGNTVEPNIAASSVSGGTNNTASGPNSSISGGVGNKAAGSGSSVSGGENNTANGAFSSVSGGSNRSAPQTENWAAGALFQPN